MKFSAEFLISLFDILHGGEWRDAEDLERVPNLNVRSAQVHGPGQGADGYPHQEQQRAFKNEWNTREVCSSSPLELGRL